MVNLNNNLNDLSNKTISDLTFQGVCNCKNVHSVSPPINKSSKGIFEQLGLPVLKGGDHN